LGEIKLPVWNIENEGNRMKGEEMGGAREGCKMYENVIRKT
jgi:hypothetical protein